MLLTHQHIDHLGLVSLVAAHSGAEVAAIEAAVPFVRELLGRGPGRGRLRPRRDAPQRDLGGRDGGAPVGLARLSRLGLARGGHAGAARRRPVELRDRSLEVAFRPGPQPQRHRLLGPRARAPDRRRPPARPHLVQPAHHAQVGRLGRALAGADRLPRLAAAHARDGRGARPARPRRPGHRPPNADRRALRDARAPGGQDPPAGGASGPAPPTRSPRRSGATSPSRRRS